MPSALEFAIWKTVAWFSLFETPVTVFEMWKWMLEPEREYRLEEAYAALEGEWLRARLVHEGGFWTRTEDRTRRWGAERRARFLDAVRKYAKLRAATRYLRIVPGVETISAGNTLAWWNTRPDSDIDVFVVTRPGTIWLSRLLCVTPFALLGKRPGTSSVDPFCFSFFVTTDAPPISSLTLEGGDPYLDLWSRSLVPVFVRDQANERGASRPGPIAVMLERSARTMQMRRLPHRIQEMMNKDSRVVINDQVLKFHDNDRRAEYRTMLRQLCSAIASPMHPSS